MTDLFLPVLFYEYEVRRLSVFPRVRKTEIVHAFVNVARSKLRFRTSCAGEATSVRLVRRAAASTLASAALVSNPITSSATGGDAQSASASASQTSRQNAPPASASAWLTIRYEEEDVTAREARCGVAATEADGMLPIAPDGSGSAPAINFSE